MFKKKFKVRVKYYGRGKCAVQYTNHRIIPSWESLCYWFDQGHPGGTQCWSVELLDICDAEKLAKKTKTMKDVGKYYVPYEKERAQWHKDEHKFLERKAPYATKEF